MDGLTQLADWHDVCNEEACSSKTQQIKTNILNNSKTNKSMNIKQLADRVVILPAPAETKTVGGIIIPDTAKEKPLQGEVVAAGNGTKD